MKGVANHRRVQILALLAQEPEMTLAQIAAELDIDFRITSEHIRRMSAGGLVLKRYEGRYVHHTLTPRARTFLHS